MGEFEPTYLPYVKKFNDDEAFLDEKVLLNRLLIEKLSQDNDFDSNLLILAAICITLTKYNNSTEIFISVDNNPLIFDDKNRNKSVFEYINSVQKYLTQITDVDNKSFFNISFNNVSINNNGIKLYVCDNSLKLNFDSNKYTTYYIKSFLRSINKVINQFDEYGIDNLKIKDIKLRDEKPVPDFKLKRNPLVNELLELQANKTPDNIALITCSESYTFKEINDDANRIANALIKRGFREGSSIAFLLKRDKTLITTFLGIIKAGCIAIPLDINFAPEKLNYILENSDSKCIITYENMENSIKPDDLINDGEATFPSINLKPNSPIFLLYTSGSTGQPKGVISTHCGISNLISVHIKTNYNKLLSISSISFDISEEDILVTLTNGSMLIFANDDEIKDIVLLSCLIEKTEPEFVNLTPSRILSYMQVPEFCHALSKFKGIGCGGELFTKNIYESIKK